MEMPLIPLPPISRDQRTIAERKWRAPLKPAAPQLPCDAGLFGDDMNQLEMVEMFMPPPLDEGE